MASSSSAGLDAFYQEVGFHLGLPTNTIQLKMQQEMRGFTAKVRRHAPVLPGHAVAEG